MDVNGMKNTINDLQKQMKEQSEKFENEKNERAFQDKLDSFISKKNGKNTRAIKSLLDIETLRTSNNQDADIDEALNNVIKDNDYLFGTSEPIKKAVMGGTASSEVNNDEKISMARKVMGLPPLKNE